MPTRAKKGISETFNTPTSGAELINVLKKELSEMEILLSLNNDIASIRNKKDILKIIHPKLKQLFNTEDIFICVLDKGNETLDPFLRVGNKRRIEHPGYEKWMNSKFSIHDGFIDSILKAEKPIVFDIEEICSWSKAPGYIKISKEAGIVESLSKTLKNGNELVGIITLWAEKKNSFKNHHLALIEKIADQVSVLVTNILSHEALLQKDRENQLLLEISNEIAAIRDKDDLTRILSVTLKKYIQFDDSTITLYNKERNTYRIYAYHMEETRLKHPHVRAALDYEYPLNDSNLSNSHTPVVADVEALFKNGTKQVEFIYNAGIKEYATIKLVDGDNLIGLFVLLSENKNSFTPGSLYIMQRISYQISIAVAKLLAIDELSKREKEKDILLTVSKEFTSVRKREELLPLLKKQLERFSFYSDIVIAKVDDNNKTFSGFVVNEETDRIEDPEYPEMRDAHHPFPDGVFDVALQSDKPIVFDVDKLANQPGPLPYIKFIYDNGTVDMVGISLRDGYKAIGVLFLFAAQKKSLTELQFNLAQGIGNQLGTVVSNILTNEKLKKQLEEINRYKEQLQEEKQYLQEEVSSGYTYSDIIGNGPEMQKVFHQLSQVSFADSTVLILGETGTGKELVARAIHNSSPRREKLMVKVNCAAMVPNLVESELFGHERGSFTGATERRIGKFELANHGTLFLDEIGEMPAELQVKLLRAIQEREIERVGGKLTIKVDVRIITATNRDLQKEVDEGRFRRDLFYRLNVFPIMLPALRERKKDIPVLVSHFINKYSKNTGKQIKDVSSKVMKQLIAYDWPGNVRELEHLIERTLLTTTNKTIKEVHLPIDNKLEIKTTLKDEYLMTHEENERDYIIRVLNKCNGKIFGPGGAADILKLRVSTLNSKIKKLGIKKNKLFK